MAMFNYESDVLYQQARGETIPSTPVYVAECKKEIIDEVSPNYPQLVEYEKELLNFAQHNYHPGTPVPLEYQEVNTYDYAIVENAIPFNYKSAILKGCSLVNLASEKTKTGANNLNIRVGYLKPNTQYTAIFNYISDNPIIVRCSLGIAMGVNNVSFVGENGLKKVLLTTPELTSSNYRLFIYTNNKDTYTVDEVMVIEGNYTDVDIPYFTSMLPVKMPVLTTTGKNLYSYGDLTINNPITERWYYTNGKSSSFGSSCKRTDGGNWFYLEKGVYSYKSINENVLTNIVLVGEGEKQYSSGTEIPSGWYVFRFKTKPESVDYVKISQIQLEKSPNITTYEPYKSNILSTPSDLELRGVGDVKDGLDLLTGEVTKCIGEIALDGSDDENWLLNSSYVVNGQICYKIKLTDMNANMVYPTVLSDKLPYILKGYSGNVISISTYQNDLFVRLNGNTKEDLKRWLSEKPLTVQYPLISESIKTVDLSTSIKPYEGTNHYHVSSDTIPPQLLLSVPVVSTGNQTLNDIITEE